MNQIKFFGYECPVCGNDTWLADQPEKFVYCAHCGGETGTLTVSKILVIEDGRMTSTEYRSCLKPGAFAGSM